MPRRSQILHPLLERFLFVLGSILEHFSIVFGKGDGLKIGLQTLLFYGAVLQRQEKEKQRKRRSSEYGNPSNHCAGAVF